MDDWTEQWSFGVNGSRVFCGIARTDEGFAVDVFYSDTCVASFPCRSQQEAEHVARDLRFEYAPGLPLAALRMPA